MEVPQFKLTVYKSADPTVQKLRAAAVGSVRNRTPVNTDSYNCKRRLTRINRLFEGELANDLPNTECPPELCRLD